MSYRFLGLVATLGALSTVPLAGTRSTFVPDWTFKGSTLAGWHVLGAGHLGVQAEEHLRFVGLPGHAREPGPLEPRRIDGRVVAPDTGDLGAAVVGEYLRAHFRGHAFGDADWAG